jgi:transcriptional regulator with XRE-family HTH domain
MQEKSASIFRSMYERITDRMAERGMTKIELARRSGVSYRLVWDITMGKAHPRTEIVESLARILRVDPEFLLTGEKTNAAPAPMMVKEGCVYPETRNHSAPKRTTVASLVREMAELLEMPETLMWDCVQDMIEKKRKVASDRKSKAG